MASANERIRDLREEKNLEANYLASYLNVSQDAYYDFETGGRNIPLEIMIKLAKFYSVSVEYIIGR